MIPGSNLLSTALGVIAKQTFTYRQFDSRATNAIGIDVPAYLADVELSGSVQPVARNLYQDQGLDYKKHYITIYSTDKINGVNPGGSGDLVIFAGRKYQVLAENDWTLVDGWNGVLCVGVD